MSRMLPLIVLAAPLMLAACADPEAAGLSGYAEADYLYLSAREAGDIQSLAIQEGDSVSAGDAIATLDTARHEAALARAEAAQAAAEAAFTLAEANNDRTTKLFKEGQTPAAQRDAAQASLDAAAQDVAAAAAAVRAARLDLEDRIVLAPEAGRIERIYRRQGERVGTNEPIAALLPPARLEVRFFVPQDRLSEFQAGQLVGIACDGCPDDLRARISFIADEPQFTPPVIYSREERAKLVFLIKARPESPALGLHPGQPLEIRVLP